MLADIMRLAVNRYGPLFAHPVELNNGGVSGSAKVIIPREDSFWGAENHGIVIWGLSMSPYLDGLHGEGIYIDSLVLKVNSNPAVVTTG